MATKKMGAGIAKRGYHHGNLREDLIRSGLEVIAEKGVRALTLREIGSRLGVSRMAAYRHFADKAALLAAISEMAFNKFGDGLAEAAARKNGHYARLEEMAVAYVRFAMENQAQFEVMFGRDQDGGSGGETVAGRRAFSILLEAVRAAQVAGKLAGDEPLQTAQGLWAMVHGISLLGMEQDAAGAAEFTRACTRMLRKGLQPR